MQPLRPNEKRARTAIILIWIVFFAELLLLAGDWLQYNFLEAVVNGAEVTEEAVTANDLRQRILGVLYITVYAVSGFTFIQWFRRAYFNLHLRVSQLSESEGWAAGSWFVPFYNLYKPYRIMKELYTETALILKKDTITARIAGTGLLRLWWVLWIVNNFLGQLSGRLLRKAEGINELISATNLSMLDSVLGLVLAVITVKVIHDYSAMEALLANVTEEHVEEKSDEALSIVMPALFDKNEPL